MRGNERCVAQNVHNRDNQVEQLGHVRSVVQPWRTKGHAFQVGKVGCLLGRDGQHLGDACHRTHWVTPNEGWEHGAGDVPQHSADIVGRTMGRARRRPYTKTPQSIGLTRLSQTSQRPAQLRQNVLLCSCPGDTKYYGKPDENSDMLSEGWVARMT